MLLTWAWMHAQVQNFALNLCQMSPALFCLFNLFCHSVLPKKHKKNKNDCKTPLWKSSAPQSQEAAFWKGTWPLAFQPRPRSEPRATVVITERLIADRTFQQPVVNWMELRGRKLQMHRLDRCSADDLYFRVVWGRACHFVLFILLSQICKKKRQTSRALSLQPSFERRIKKNPSRAKNELPEFIQKKIFILGSWRAPSEAVTSPPSFQNRTPPCEFTCNFLQIILGVKLFKHKETVLLKQIRTHFTVRVGGMCDCGDNAWPQLVQCTLFQPDYASFLLRVVIWEASRSFITTIWML